MDVQRQKESGRAHGQGHLRIPLVIHGDHPQLILITVLDAPPRAAVPPLDSAHGDLHELKTVTRERKEMLANRESAWPVRRGSLRGRGRAAAERALSPPAEHRREAVGPHHPPREFERGIRRPESAYRRDGQLNGKLAPRLDRPPYLHHSRVPRRDGIGFRHPNAHPRSGRGDDGLDRVCAAKLHS